MMERFVGKVALVTGAGFGIGAASAKRFAAEGAKVAVLDINGDAANRVTQEIRDAGGEAISLVADVTRTEQVEAAFQETLRQFGRLDVMFANAGIADPTGAVADVPEDKWLRVIDVNLNGVYRCIKAALPPMRRQKSGVIIATSSIEGLRTGMTNIEYHVSKAGVIMLIQHVALTYGSEGIRAIAICPGPVDTGILQPLYDAAGSAMARRLLRRASPLGRMAQPEEIAASVAFLASDEASFVTGIAYSIDGGMNVGIPHRASPLARGYLSLRARARRLTGKPTPKLRP